ncbi:MarR family transcriptional regulator [Marinilactibacillus psychrotolerans]
MKEKSEDLKELSQRGFTVREIEKITGISKSQVSRALRKLVMR